MKPSIPNRRRGGDLLAEKKNMTPSKENYLKTILALSDGEGARSIDIAAALGVSKASVSNMMESLCQDGYVDKQKYGTITLTESGRVVAMNIQRKYELLKEFLRDVLGVDSSTAAGDACRIEHLISAETTTQIDRQLRARSLSGDEP
jgi:DtxR family Mn-dependent transcriptional regulator